jgi:hypothetical protein
VHWLQPDTGPAIAYVGSAFFYGLALLSKESAVAVLPLCLLAAACHKDRPLKRLWGLTPFVLGAAAYFVLAYGERRTHLHFNDGTFSLGAPFVQVLLRSATSVSRIWGLAGLALIAIAKVREWRLLLIIAGAWIAITLLPYSFLTYMPVVPSRHTYLASVGASLVVAAGLLTLQKVATSRNRGWIVPVTATVMILHQSGYLWTVKHRQYALRAAPTEELIRVGSQGAERIYVKCFPYGLEVAELALRLRLDERPSKPLLITGPVGMNHADAVDFCNAVVHHSNSSSLPRQ